MDVPLPVTGNRGLTEKAVTIALQALTKKQDSLEPLPTPPLVQAEPETRWRLSLHDPKSDLEVVYPSTNPQPPNPPSNSPQQRSKFIQLTNFLMAVSTADRAAVDTERAMDARSEAAGAGRGLGFQPGQRVDQN